jgi:hypothetical protein
MASTESGVLQVGWVLRAFRLLLGLTVLAIVGLKLRLLCGGYFGYDGWVLLSLTVCYLLYSVAPNTYTSVLLSLCCAAAGAHFINVGYGPYYTDNTYLALGVLLVGGGVLVFHTEVWNRRTVKETR